VASLLVRLPSPQTVYLELSAYSLEGPATLEVAAEKEVVGTHVIGQETTVITTSDLALPAGESVIQIRADVPPTEVIFTRIELVVAE